VYKTNVVRLKKGVRLVNIGCFNIHYYFESLFFMKISIAIYITEDTEAFY